MTSYIEPTCEVNVSVLICRVPRVNLGRDSEVWLADPSGSCEGTLPIFFVLPG